MRVWAGGSFITHLCATLNILTYPLRSFMMHWLEKDLQISPEGHAWLWPGSLMCPPTCFTIALIMVFFSYFNILDLLPWRNVEPGVIQSMIWSYGHSHFFFFCSRIHYLILKKKQKQTNFPPVGPLIHVTLFNLKHISKSPMYKYSHFLRYYG